MHVVALLASFAGLWIILVGTPSDAAGLGFAGAAAALSLLWIARFGGVDRESAPLWRLIRLAPMFVGRGLASARGAALTARTAIAADVPLKPALVRVKLRPQSQAARAALAHFVSAEPGGVVVDIERDSLLVHVLQEEAIDAPQLARIESAVVRAVDGS